MVVAYWNGFIKVFDGGGDNLVELKTCYIPVKKLVDNISTLAVSEHHGLIAAGSSKGAVIVIDQESMKIIAIYQQHVQNVTFVGFVGKYPLLISCGMDGLLCVYSIRGTGINKQD